MAMSYLCSIWCRGPIMARRPMSSGVFAWGRSGRGHRLTNLLITYSWILPRCSLGVMVDEIAEIANIYWYQCARLTFILFNITKIIFSKDFLDLLSTSSCIKFCIPTWWQCSKFSHVSTYCCQWQCYKKQIRFQKAKFGLLISSFNFRFIYEKLYSIRVYVNGFNERLL